MFSWGPSHDSQLKVAMLVGLLCICLLRLIRVVQQFTSCTDSRQLTQQSVSVDPNPWWHSDICFPSGSHFISLFYVLVPFLFTYLLSASVFTLLSSFLLVVQMSLSLSLSFSHTLSTSLSLIQPFCLFTYTRVPESALRSVPWVQLFSCFVYFCLIVALKVTGSSCVTTQTQTQNETSTCRIVLLLQSNGDLYLWLIILSVPLSTLTTG